MLLVRICSVIVKNIGAKTNNKRGCSKSLQNVIAIPQNAGEAIFYRREIARLRQGFAGQALSLVPLSTPVPQFFAGQ